MTSDAISGYQAASVPARLAAARQETAVLCRTSVQPSRRAVLHVQAVGDPQAPADLAAWFSERSFHFYVASIRLPSLGPVGARPTVRYLTAAMADLDAARAHLLARDGMASVVVTAGGRAAIAAALWQDARESAADALILHDPALPSGASLALDIDCPVLVLSEPRAASAVDAVVKPRGRRLGLGSVGLGRLGGRHPGRGSRAIPARLQLGGHVTWLRMADDVSQPETAGRQQFFDELGRWLGAYMYGRLPDQLL